MPCFVFFKFYLKKQSQSLSQSDFQLQCTLHVNLQIKILNLKKSATSVMPYFAGSFQFSMTQSCQGSMGTFNWNETAMSKTRLKYHDNSPEVTTVQVCFLSRTWPVTDKLLSIFLELIYFCSVTFLAAAALWTYTSIACDTNLLTWFYSPKQIQTFWLASHGTTHAGEAEARDGQ